VEGSKGDDEAEEGDDEAEEGDGEGEEGEGEGEGEEDEVMFAVLNQMNDFDDAPPRHPTESIGHSDVRQATDRKRNPLTKQPTTQNYR